MPRKTKSKSKKAKKNLKKNKFKLPFKITEDQESNLIVFGVIVLGIILYYFGILGTIIKFILGAWVWWAILISVIGILFIGKKL